MVTVFNVEIGDADAKILDEQSRITGLSVEWLIRYATRRYLSEINGR